MCFEVARKPRIIVLSRPETWRHESGKGGTVVTSHAHVTLFDLVIGTQQVGVVTVGAGLALAIVGLHRRWAATLSRKRQERVAGPVEREAPRRAGQR